MTLFSTRLRPLLQLTQPLLRRLRVERPLREVYLALHAFRGDVPLLVAMFGLTLGSRLPPPDCRESSLPPISGRSGRNEERIASPRSSDCDVAVLPSEGGIGASYRLVPTIGTPS